MSKILIVVDMQNDFIDGALGTKEAQEIVPKVKKKIEEYEKNNYPIIFTRDTHPDYYLETQEGKKLPVKHCIYETDGWQISNKLNSANGRILNKYTFGFDDWEFILNDYIFVEDLIEEIELIGLCTDICVISNAIILKSLYSEIPITVDASCCAGVTPQSHKNALEAMKMCQIDIINEEE